MSYELEFSSFRDPSGFIFHKDGILYRQINESYKENYDHLINSELYDELVSNDLLIPHKEVIESPPLPEKAYKVIQPEKISFISYPYEWSFSQLKQAALTSLEIQKISMNFGMSLKDCSAFNIQMRNAKPILIDTLSFEKYQEGQTWKAYKQFCQHFLAPLALISYRDIRLSQLFRIYMDGIPLDLTSKLLPFRTRSMFSLLAHIHIHSKSQKHFGSKQVNVKNRTMSKKFLYWYCR